MKTGGPCNYGAQKIFPRFRFDEFVNGKHSYTDSRFVMAAYSEDYFTGDELEAVHFFIEQDFLIGIDEDVEVIVENEKKEFKCDFCNKSYKTERGFNRHKKNHVEFEEPTSTSSSSLSSEYFNQHIIKELVEKSAKKVAEEALYPETILSELRDYVLNIEDATFVYYSFLKDVITNNIRDSEKFYPSFYKIFTSHIFKDLSKQASTLVGFELANQVLCYVKQCEEVGKHSKNSTSVILTERENSVVAYISGYVLSTFYRRIRKSNCSDSDFCQKQLSLLKAGKIENPENDDELSFNKLIDSHNRGGLWYVNSDVLNIFTVTFLRSP